MKHLFVSVLVSVLAISSLHKCDAFTRPKRCAQEALVTTEQTIATAPPGFCEQSTMYCKEYNGITLFIDSTSFVNYYKDMGHCESFGAKLYIPETEADNEYMLNFLKELAQGGPFPKYLSYPLIAENGALFWKDGEGTSFDSGEYWKSPEISEISCYYLASSESSFMLTSIPCNYSDNNHLCVFS